MGVEYWWKNTDREKSNHSREKSGPVPLRPPQIPYGLAYK